MEEFLQLSQRPVYASDEEIISESKVEDISREFFDE
jgi:hypothetical protein